MTRPLPLAPSPRSQPCDLCGATKFAVIDRSDRHRTPLTTVICHQCGLLAHETIPDDEELNRYYEVQYRQDYHGEIMPAPHRVIRAWEGGQWLFRQLRRHVAAGSRVCEVGAGIGCTVKAFELAGFDAEGIEPGKGFQRFAREQLGARVTRATLFDLTPQPTYDFVLLVHVIEHFNSPRRALLHIHKLLREEGRLYVECPNIGAPHAAPGKQFHFAHIHNFTPQTLEMLSHDCGFRVVARLAAPRARAIRLLLERVATAEPCTARSDYVETLRRLQSCSSFRYHMRPSYWLDRLHRDARFVSHHVMARRRLRKLLHRCQARPYAGAHPTLLTGQV